MTTAGVPATMAELINGGEKELWYDCNLRPLNGGGSFKQPKWVEKLEAAGLDTCGEPHNLAFIFRAIGEPVPPGAKAVVLEWNPEHPEVVLNRVWVTGNKPVTLKTKWELVFERDENTAQSVGLCR